MDGVQLPQSYRAIMRRQFIFYHYVPAIPQNDERLSWLNLKPPSGFEHRNLTPFIEWQASAQFSCQNQNFVNTSKILWKNTEAATRGVLWKRPATLLKRRLWHTRCFLVNFVKFLTTPFSQNTSRHLVLIAWFNPGQTWVLFNYGFSKTQLTWIKQASRPTLPNLAGSFKKST